MLGEEPSLGKKNSLCQSPEKGPCLLSWRNIEEAHVAEAMMEGGEWEEVGTGR